MFSGSSLSQVAHVNLSRESSHIYLTTSSWELLLCRASIFKNYCYIIQNLFLVQYQLTGTLYSLTYANNNRKCAKTDLALCSLSLFLSIMRCLASHWDLHTCMYTFAKTHTHTHTHSHKRQAASKLGFCVVAHANEAKRSEMNPLSQRGARGVLQAENSVREGAWQANAPSVDSFHRTYNGKRWGPTTAFFRAIGFPFHRI